MTSGRFPYSALLGSTVDTCCCQSTSSWVLPPYTAQCLSSVVHVMRQSTECKFFRFFLRERWITDPEVDSRLSGVSASHLFVASPEEYMIWMFWEMTSGCFPFSALLVSTLDTYSASVYGCFWKNLVFLRDGLPARFALGNLNIISSSSSYDVEDGFFAVK